MKKEYLIAVQGMLAAAGGFLSDRLGILFPVLGTLMLMMVVDYITGMLASKVEALDHPGDKTYGWTSKKGAKGIIKKVGYLCVIAVAMVVDFIIVRLSKELGYQMPVTAFFGLMVAVWYILNELLSIIENAGRMGANVPAWLSQYIAVLKDKIDSNDYGQGKDKPVNK